MLLPLELSLTDHVERALSLPHPMRCCPFMPMDLRFAMLQSECVDSVGAWRQGQWEGLEWQMNFETLLKFRAVNGHCDVPKDHKLSAWVVNMRQNRHDLPFEYKNLLDMAGFTWERRGAWARMFAQLASFREENGHVLVPRQSTDHLHNHLGAWLVNQRALWRMGKLTGQQISRLQGIGVEL